MHARVSKRNAIDINRPDPVTITTKRFPNNTRSYLRVDTVSFGIPSVDPGDAMSANHIRPGVLGGVPVYIQYLHIYARGAECAGRKVSDVGGSFMLYSPPGYDFHLLRSDG